MRLPLKDIFVTQPFGMNYLDFYQKLGMIGHNGVDFRAKNGCPAYACFDGIINYCGVDSGGGVQVDIWNRGGLKAVYYHLQDYNVTQGQLVKAGDIIGHCDNTGLMTTGSHLHFGLKEVNSTGHTLNWGNGFHGAIDPAPYFDEAYNGFSIGSNDYDKSRSYQRYYREAKRNLANEMKTALYMARRLKRLPNNEEINMAIWGGWDIEAIINPAMYENTSQLKKGEYLAGQRSFN